MNIKDFEQMDIIESKCVVGADISDFEREFYNSHIEEMKEDVKSLYYTWVQSSPSNIV